MSHVKVCEAIPQEFALSDCQYGCKVMKCPDCGYLVIEHLKSYGHQLSYQEPVMEVQRVLRIG